MLDFADIFDTSTEFPEKNFRTRKKDSKLFNRTFSRQQFVSPHSQRY